MRIASIFIVGQHPKGLDLHLRNLRWALNRPHTIYVLTFREWNFDKSDYPDVKFLEIDRPAMEYYNFWGETIPDFIRSLNEDVILLTESDQFFHTQIGAYADSCFDKICVGLETYGWQIYRNQVQVYPRLWECGLLIPRKTFIKHLDLGVDCSWTNLSETMCQRLKSSQDAYFFGLSGKPVMLNQADTSVIMDVMGQLTLSCYIEGELAHEIDYLDHLGRPETIHRQNPHLYGQLNRDDLPCVPYPGPQTTFMYYLSGVTEIFPEMAKFWGDSKDLMKKIHRIAVRGKEWMTPEQADRLRTAITMSKFKI